MTKQLAIGFETCLQTETCDGCKQPNPIYFNNDNGRFCIDCEAHALRCMTGWIPTTEPEEEAR